MYAPGGGDRTENRVNLSLLAGTIANPADGTISGGMIPKLECCVDAIAGGVERVHILDGRIPHSILIELLSDRGIGTMLKKED